MATDETRSHNRNHIDFGFGHLAYDFVATYVAKTVARCPKPKIECDFGCGLESHRWHIGGSARLRSLAFSVPTPAFAYVDTKMRRSPPARTTAVPPMGLDPNPKRA